MDSSVKTLSLIVVSTLAPYVAYSETYLTEDQALKVIFPKDTFTKKELELTSDETKIIESKSGEKVRSHSLSTWVSIEKNSKDKNIVFVDQVVGKHEFITFAVGITKDGAVKDIEILEYRESYGSQVKTEEWRKQFVGKTMTSPLKLGSDITNISGATLSSLHVTAGVRRILQTYDIVKTKI